MRKLILTSIAISALFALQANANTAPTVNNYTSTTNNAADDTDTSATTAQSNDNSSNWEQMKEQTKQTTSDSAITTAVKAKLLANSETSGLKIHVMTNNNVVTLKGIARTLGEKVAAERIAKETANIRVINDIRIKAD